MKITTPRRDFLQRTFLATAGISLISANAFSKLIDNCPYDGYNQFADEKSDLRTNLFGKHLTVKGIIFDQEANMPLSNVLIEVWHKSPGSTKFRHHGKFRSADDGSYEFITDLPEKGDALTAKIFFKVSDGQEELFTELCIGTNDAYITSHHFQQQYKLGKHLFPTREKYLNQSTINFNILLTN